MTRHGYWFSQNEGKVFKRKRGRVPHRLEKIHVDYSYQPYYNFTVETVRLVNLNTGRGLWRPIEEVYYDWEEVEGYPRVRSSQEESDQEHSAKSNLSCPVERDYLVEKPLSQQTHTNLSPRSLEEA